MILLHNLCVAEFNRQFYKDLLTVEHLDSGELKLNKLSYPNGSVDDEANFWGFRFKKNGDKYLVTSKDKRGSPINVHDMLPILAKGCDKVAHSDTAYWMIDNIIPAGFTPRRVMSFKEYIDKLSDFSHTNDKHLKLLHMVAFTMLTQRAYFRICSPPGFGKDSAVDINRALIGDCTTIVSPTLAKLQFLSPYRWVAINEVSDVSKGDWRILSQYLLDAGSWKPEIPKHSRATSGVGEFINLKNHSLSLFYNDIENYPEDKYFDIVANDALQDRFPPLRLYGRFTEDFDQVKDSEIKAFVKEHYEEYRELVYTFTYFKENRYADTHGYTTKIFNGFHQRWQRSIKALCTTIDLYSESPAEYDYWCEEIKNSIIDYNDMLEFKRQLERFNSKLEKLPATKRQQIRRELGSIDTYTKKLHYLHQFSPSTHISEQGLGDW